VSKHFQPQPTQSNQKTVQIVCSPKLHDLSEFPPNKILWHKQAEARAVYQNKIVCQKPYGTFQVSCYLAWKIVKVEGMSGAIPLLPHMPSCCEQGWLHLSLCSVVIHTSGLPAVLISLTTSTGATPQYLYCRYTGGELSEKKGHCSTKGYNCLNIKQCLGLSLCSKVRFIISAQWVTYCMDYSPLRSY